MGSLFWELHGVPGAQDTQCCSKIGGRVIELSAQGQFLKMGLAGRPQKSLHFQGKKDEGSGGGDEAGV